MEGLSPNIMPSLVKLNKGFYGLRQAAHEWRLLLDSTLKGFGFTQLKTDACVYHLVVVHQPVTGALILGVFVDDIFYVWEPVNLLFNGFNPSYQTNFQSQLNLMLNLFWVCM